MNFIRVLVFRKVAPSLNQNSFDNDSDVSWKSSTVDEQKAHRYRRKEVKT